MCVWVVGGWEGGGWGGGEPFLLVFARHLENLFLQRALFQAGFVKRGLVFEDSFWMQNVSFDQQLHHHQKQLLSCLLRILIGTDGVYFKIIQG